MNRRNQNTYETLTHVAAFAAGNVNLFPKTSAAADITATLVSEVKTLSVQNQHALAFEPKSAPTRLFNILDVRRSRHSHCG